MKKIIRIVCKIIKRYNNWGWKYFFIDLYESLKYKYSKYKSGELALKKMVKDFSFDSVMDIGCGNGFASEFFTDHGKNVTAIDYGKSPHFKDTMAKNVIIGDFNELKFDKKYDAIWCCMVLEHQLDVQTFLAKINSFLKEGGVLCVTVPRKKDGLVGGHVSLWNPGMLIYRLVLAGFDCQNAHVKCYGYNISVIVEKKSISVLDRIAYDKGDLLLLEQYFPKKMKRRPIDGDIQFCGNFKSINW